MSSYVTDQMRKALANHRLELVQEGPVTAYYLKDPTEGRMMSTLVLFSPEGIVLQGDLTPERNGTVSCYGYGIGWFGSPKSEDYLCEKFLEKRFVQEAAITELKDPDSYWRDLSGIETGEWYRRIERLDEIIDDLESDGHEAEWLIGELEDAGCVVDDWPPGWTYEPREAGWLCAIQQRFAELYQEELARVDQGPVAETMRDRLGQGPGDARAAEPAGALAGDRSAV